MFGIDGIIVALVIAAVTLGAISWTLGRAEQRRYEEVMRTGEMEAARAGASDRPVTIPQSHEPRAGYLYPASLDIPQPRPADTRRADAPGRT